MGSAAAGFVSRDSAQPTMIAITTSAEATPAISGIFDFGGSGGTGFGISRIGAGTCARS